MSLNIMHNFLKNWKKKRNTYDFWRAGQELRRWLRREDEPKGGGPANRVHGGTKEGGARRDRRSPEQEAPSRTQATAMMMVHSGADGGRSHGRRLQWAEQRRRSRWWSSPRQRQRADEPGECRGSGGPGWSRGLWRRGPEIRNETGATEDPGGANGRKKPNRDGATKRSQRIGVQRRWRVDARPRRSRRDEWAQWSDELRWRRGS